MNFRPAICGIVLTIIFTVSCSSGKDEIADLISQMSLEEKVHQLATQYPNANMRLGIPNMSANECLHGIKMDSATVFPQAIAMASTWDGELITRMGTIVAKESRAFGIHQCYSPMVSVVRDVRWGRTEESYGEDPFLVGKIGAAYIRGLQGMGSERFDKDHIMATAKHYVADGEPMGGDNGAAMDVSDYTLHNVHLYPFRLAIEEAQVGSIMPAHHLLNGVPCHANKKAMVDILREMYGWDGLIVSDNGDIRALKTTFSYAETEAEAARYALEAGIHQELALFQSWNKTRMYGDYLIEAVNSGEVAMELVDNAVAHVLRAKTDMGLFESKEQLSDGFDVIAHPENGNPKTIREEDIEIFAKALYVGSPRENCSQVINDPAHNEMALEVARKAIVLLKNEEGILPLDPLAYKSIAVIGPNADAMRLGGYSPEIPRYFVTIVDGIKDLVGDQVRIQHANGCDFSSESLDKIDEAVQLARKSDLVILAVGGSEETCRENEDRDDLNLAGNQDALAKAIHASGKPYVVVLLNGRPLSIDWLADKAPAIVEGWYLGQETGSAMAEVLFGITNPGGKLPITFPRNVGQVPHFYNKLPTGRPRRIYQSDPEALFPFGYGLSYTTFEIGTPVLDQEQIGQGSKTNLRVNIRNTGKRSGDEVVQLYVHDKVSTRVRPLKELRGFQRVSLEAGESRELVFEVGQQELEYWVDGKWTIEAGEFEMMIGPDSQNLQSTTLSVIN